MDMLAPGHRYSIPESTTPLPMNIDMAAPARPSQEMVLDVEAGPAKIDSALIQIPDGPLTLECWMQADSFSRRTGLLAKTENSDYGFFVNDGRPTFSVHVGGAYAEAGPDDPLLEPGRWYHLAGVFDGRETRLYVDGKLVGSAERSGSRRTNALPLYIGADVDGRGNPTSPFDGRIDEVRLSTVARYSADFTPQRRLEADDQTALLLHMDAEVGIWLHDASGRDAHPSIGKAALVEAGR